jgi:hypothetical protein
LKCNSVLAVAACWVSGGADDDDEHPQNANIASTEVAKIAFFTKVSAFEFELPLNFLQSVLILNFLFDFPNSRFVLPYRTCQAAID